MKSCPLRQIKNRGFSFKMVLHYYRPDQDRDYRSLYYQMPHLHPEGFWSKTGYPHQHSF